MGCVRYLRAPPPLRRYVGAEGRLWGVGLGRDGSSRGGWARAGQGTVGQGKAKQSKSNVLPPLLPRVVGVHGCIG